MVMKFWSRDWQTMGPRAASCLCNGSCVGAQLWSFLYMSVSTLTFHRGLCTGVPQQRGVLCSPLWKCADSS